MCIFAEKMPPTVLYTFYQLSWDYLNIPMLSSNESQTQKDGKSLRCELCIKFKHFSASNSIDEEHPASGKDLCRTYRFAGLLSFSPFLGHWPTRSKLAWVRAFPQASWEQALKPPLLNL